jgi:hypothetical protein
MPRVIPELVIRNDSNTFSAGTIVMPFTRYEDDSTSTAATRFHLRRAHARPKQFWRTLPQYKCRR